jgi:hypothetical protein
VGAPTIGTGEYAVLPDELSISFWSVSGTWILDILPTMHMHVGLKDMK